MSKRYDWDAIAMRLNEHLDSLKPYQRPMKLTVFARVFGCNRNSFVSTAMRNPSSLWAKSYDRHRELDAQWMGELMQAIVVGRGRHGHFASVAQQWGLTRLQVEHFMHKNRRLWLEMHTLVMETR